MNENVMAEQSTKRAAAATRNKVIVRGLNFYYGQAHALKGRKPEPVRGSGDGVHRPIGLRQVDAAAGFEPHV